MVGLVVRRLLLLVPTLLFVSFGIFSLIALVPGDAAVTLAGGADAQPADVEAVRQAMHLDRPFLSQYVHWLGGAVHFDFGTSLLDHSRVGTQLADRLPVTLGLVAVVALFALLIAALVGIGGGLRPGSIVDRAALFGSSVSMSMPSFWVALVLVTVFAVSLRWLPPFAFVHFSDSPFEWFRHLILPGIALALTPAAILARQLRSGLTETMQSAYIRTAWAKGGSTRQVVVGHALKNSAFAPLTVLGLQASGLLGASVIIERIFSIPGLGSYLLQAVFLKDIPVVLGVAVVYVVINVLINLVVDISYGLVNPKVRVS